MPHCIKYLNIFSRHYSSNLQLIALKKSSKCDILIYPVEEENAKINPNYYPTNTFCHFFCCKQDNASKQSQKPCCQWWKTDNTSQHIALQQKDYPPLKTAHRATKPEQLLVKTRQHVRTQPFYYTFHIPQNYSITGKCQTKN